MRTHVDLVEYVLPLSTGETLLVTELDPDAVPELRDPAVAACLEPVLCRCTYAPRRVLEDAKNGGTAELEDLLGTPPVGCLLKLDRPHCHEYIVSVCAVASGGCNTRNVRRGRPCFPDCWTYLLMDEDPPVARLVADAVVGAWKSGRYVVVVQSSSGGSNGGS